MGFSGHAIHVITSMIAMDYVYIHNALFFEKIQEVQNQISVIQFACDSTEKRGHRVLDP